MTGLSDAEILCEYLHNFIGKQKSKYLKCWDTVNQRYYQSVLNQNVRQIDIQVNECSSNRQCERSFEEKVNAALSGMGETKAFHMKNWIEKTFNVKVG